MNSAQKYYTGDNNLSVAIPVTPGDVIVFDNNGTGEVDAYYSVLKSLTNIDVYNGAGDFCTDINTRQTVAYGASATVTIPSDANFVLVGLVYNGVDTYQFSSIKINGVEYVGGIIDMLNEIVSELRDKDEPIYPFYTAKSVITKMTDYTTLISKYDELVTLYPNILTKTQLGTTALGTPLYEYVLTTGAYNSAGSHASAADVMQKPKILLTTGMHGNENGAISSMLELFTDLVTNDALLSPLKSGLEIHLIPCVNPDGFNNGTRYNSNTVDINRNFNWNWAAGGGPVVGYHGTTAADQAETQIVQTWMAANNDAVLYLDFHNDTANDISYIYSFDLTEPICQGYKKAYLMAVNTLVSYLVKVIGLPYTSVFGYSTTFHDGGGAMCYAQNVVGLSSLLMETKTWLTGDNGKGTKTIRTCASILGNSLLNIYNFFLSLVPTGKVEQSS